MTRNDQRGHRGVPGERGYKNLGAKRKARVNTRQRVEQDLSDEEVEARCYSFLQKDGFCGEDECANKIRR